MRLSTLYWWLESRGDFAVTSLVSSSLLRLLGHEIMGLAILWLAKPFINNAGFVASMSGASPYYQGVIDIQSELVV